MYMGTIKPKKKGEDTFLVWTCKWVENKYCHFGVLFKPKKKDLTHRHTPTRAFVMKLNMSN